MTRQKIFVISFLILYLELALIRFLPAHIIYFGFFTNLTLLGVFSGMGMGFLLAKIKTRLVGYSALLLFLIVVPASFFPSVLEIQTSDVFFFRGTQLVYGALALPGSMVLPVFFTLVTLLFACLTQPLGRLFAASTQTIESYIIHTAGAIVGIVVFYLGSLFNVTPAVWFTIASVILLFLIPHRARILVPSLILLVATVVASVDRTPGETIWSPYYKLTLVRDEEGPDSILFANQITHQAMAKTTDFPFYTTIFRRITQDGPPEHVLIIGSGAGNDVAAALASGVRHVDAVDIDPVIVGMGKRFHPDKPYDDPRVTITIDDGRHFLETTKKKYDLIIFALTDSLALMSSKSGRQEVRLESFLFTLEAFRKVKSRLTQNGTFALYNDYRQQWLIDRIEAMLTTTFGQSPQIGSLGGSMRLFLSKNTPGKPQTYKEMLPTDDWPFLYVRGRAIPPFYLSILPVILFFVLVAYFIIVYKTKGVGEHWTSRHIIFFLLGFAFALLEAKSIVQLDLLFGVTWMVNALVFVGMLGSILLAAVFVWRSVVRPSPLFFLILIISTLVQFLVPIPLLLPFPPIPRFTLAIVLLYVPVFCANIFFAHMFDHSPSPQKDLASNFLGVVVGGMTEYLSLVTGYHALTLLVGALYGAAYILYRRKLTLSILP